MKDATTIGVDLAKNVFHLIGLDENWKVVMKRKLKREQFKEFIVKHKKADFYMEACAGAHYWCRFIEGYHHTAKQISPQHVKKYVLTNKNDYNDAEAILEVSRRPGMHFVSTKSPEKLSVQFIHRVRSQYVTHRVKVLNQMRGILAELGVICPKSVVALKKTLVEVLAETDCELNVLDYETINDGYVEIMNLEGKIKQYDKRLEQFAKENDVCQRLLEVEGIGVKTATALYAHTGDPKSYKNGRQFAASLGLVPKQNTTGETIRLEGISRRGDVYLRSLLVHGGRALVVASKRTATPSKRKQQIRERADSKHFNVLCVAIANKNARIAWALMAKGTRYAPLAA